MNENSPALQPAGPPTCPQCGGAISAAEETGFAECQFCGSSVYVDPGLAVRHELLLPVVREPEVAARLLSWLAAQDAIGRPEIEAPRLVFLPYWVLPEGAEHRLAPAAALLALPSAPLNLPAGDAKAFDPALATGEVIPATILLETLRADGEEPPRGARLVHLPFWDVSFRVFRTEHRALVDAVAGQVLPFTSPASSERWLDWTHAAVLIALFAIVARAVRWTLVTTPWFWSVGIGSTFVDRLFFDSLGAPRYALLQLVLAGPVAWLLVRGATWLAWKREERQ